MKKTRKNQNILIVAASEHNANLYWATRFIAPDAFIFFEIRGKKHLLMSDLEVDRAKHQSKVDAVHSISKLARAYREKTGQRATYVDLIAAFAKQQRVRDLLVPSDFPVAFADPLRQRGFKVAFKGNPFFERRTVKTREEVQAITRAIRHVETAVGLAIRALRKSVVRRGKLFYRGEKVTSESLKKIINVSLMENDCIASHSIVACGAQAVDPHDEGSGPIYANQSIIMDIFPRDSKSRYFADFTRTFVKGKASPKLKRMYQAVREGQEIAFRRIRAGADGHAIHEAINRRFEELGFSTGVQNGRMQGFFHGTGHGLGLDIHEEPSISGRPDILRSGHVVTVEPGLYYADAGGVRLEDVVVVTPGGCRNLTRFPKFLEI